MLEELDAEQVERERLALIITLGALTILLWEPRTKSGVNDAFHKLITHAQQVLRHEMLPRYTAKNHRTGVESGSTPALPNP